MPGKKENIPNYLAKNKKNYAVSFRSSPKTNAVLLSLKNYLVIAHQAYSDKLIEILSQCLSHRIQKTARLIGQLKYMVLRE